MEPAGAPGNGLPPQAEEPPPLANAPPAGPPPAGPPVLHAWLQRAAQLELWLQEAHSSLEASSMQESVEEQLSTCQEMFLEIEQKVASISSLEQQQQQQQQGELGAVGSQREEAEVLCTKLEVLKANLVSFQQLLQDKQQEEERRSRAKEQQAQLRRSSSVQEIFSSPRNKLLRQNSLQQQKELEQQLTEQRGLTRAIARQGSRARLNSQGEDTPSSWRRPAEAEEGEEEDAAAAAKKWAGLHSRLLALEQSCLLPPAQVTNSSARSTDGTAGRDINARTLTELQGLVRRLRELQHAAGGPGGGQVTEDAVDDGMFELLWSVSLSLSSISDLLRSPAAMVAEVEAQLKLQQLQSLSAEVGTLQGLLEAEGSKVGDVAGSAAGQRCVEALCRILPVVEATLSSRETHLRNLQEEATQQQSRLSELHAAFTSNQTAAQQILSELSGGVDLQRLQAVAPLQASLQQQAVCVGALLEGAESADLPTALVQEATRLQGELDHTLDGVRSRRDELQSDGELLRQHERLLLGLQELLQLGRTHLPPPVGVLWSREQQQQRLSTHTKLLRFLGQHCHTLQFLTQRLPESTLCSRQEAATRLQEGVAQLQSHDLEVGRRMQQTLQMWTQWEEDSTWTHSLLSRLETSFPRVHVGGDIEQQASELLCVYQQLGGALEAGAARFSRMLEAGLRLQGAGCRGVGVASGELEARWRAAEWRLKQGGGNVERERKLTSRFARDSALLADWMGGAREMIDSWIELPVSDSQDTDGEQRRKHFHQFVSWRTKLEVKSELKVGVMAAGAQLAQLREATEDQATSDLCLLTARLRQMETDWSSLLKDVPVVQDALHKWWVETLDQQAALQELHSWLEAAERRLEEQRKLPPSSSCAAQLLKHCQEIRTEMAAHQATLDFASQPPQTRSPEQGQRGRCEHNQFAEQQGRLGHRWLSLQQTLDSQIQEAELELRGVAERELRLQQIHSWITDQNLWIDSAQKPSSLTQLRRSVDTCQELQEKIQLKSEALQELKDKHGDTETIRGCTNACRALTQRSETVSRQLLDVEQLWVDVDECLSQLELKCLAVSGSLEVHCCPRFCLQAHRELHQRLQLLQEESQAADAEWEELSRHVPALSDAISPDAATLLSERLRAQRDGWTRVRGSLDQLLQRGGTTLQAWEVHAGLAASFTQRLQTLQSDAESALSSASGPDSGVEQLAEKKRHLEELLLRADSLQSDLQGVLAASKHLSSHLEPSAADLVQSESRLLSRGVLRLSERLRGKLGQLQEELQQLQEVDSLLDSLEEKLDVWLQRLDHAAPSAQQSDLLEPSGHSVDLDVLNQLSCSLTLGDAAARRLQCLNRSWTAAAARAEEACSELQTEALQHQSFEQKCESWMSFLQRMEDSLAVDVSGCYVGLRQQLCTHKRFQAELSMGHQILHSVISEALQLLQRGEVEDRSDFILKLAQLREHWQGAVQRADQRRSLLEGLLRHWHLYRRSLRKLQSFLADTQSILPPAGPARCSIQQLRRSLQDLQHTELLFQRYQSSFIHTLEVGRQLFSMGDEETQTQLQADLGSLQEEWDSLHGLLGRRMELTEAIVKNWESCEAGLANSMLQLKDVKTRLNLSIPEDHDEKISKENEDALEDWAQSLTELSTMKTDLSQYIMADDVLLLQEQVEHLHCQWEELCLKVSLRKQEIADRLNAWIIFNEKNKELCEWLTQMENKVAHNSDLNIEEMVEKLKKDCMEEINLFSENKTHLKQLGEQLITASNKAKETEVNDKLRDINDRWQHLFDHIEARVGKLKETLVTVQQLDKNMSNLRTWLSRIEAELAKPVVYDVCHGDEIHRKLAEQQDLQRDIEQHTDSVASVLTLCDVLLHDADACGSDSESDSIQQTSRSLDRRWRNICAMSMERRMRIEETWRLWCKFLDDYSRFEDWLKTAELTAANPDSAHVLYTSAKEELKKFEAFQRQVHERLTQLELVNKQYRRLARENRTDAASKLKVMVNEGNRRWDGLQRRVAAVLRRLKHFTSQREDFEGTREGILVWLTEMDLQLTNVEHFSESDIEDKMRQLNVFQQEITLNANKIDALIVFGENLIQKSAPLDAALIEDELEELHSYCQEVFGRVARFHQRLVSRRPVLEEERELSDRDTDLDDSPDLGGGTSWRTTFKKEEEEAGGGIPALGGGALSGRQAVCHLLAPPLERSGRETPVSVDSIPLEWDHTVDVGGSSSHEDDEDVTFFSALSVKSDPPSWHRPASPERKPSSRETIGGRSLCPPHATSTPFQPQGYAKLMSECSSSIDSVKRVKLILNDAEEELEEAGLTGGTSDKHTGTGVIERWELFQVRSFGGPVAAAAEEEEGAEPQQWDKLHSDLCDLTSWLGRVLPELERLQRIAPASGVRDIEANIRTLKEMQRTFSSYKCLMISVNLSSRHFLRGGDGAERRRLQEALSSANQGWTAACGGLQGWEEGLHAALMQCQEFQETLHAQLLWLAQAESTLRSVKVGAVSAPRAELLERRDALTALQEELRGRQRQASSLQEISAQLLLEASGEDSLEAKEKVHVIGNKLRLLLRQTGGELQALQAQLETSSAQMEADRHDDGAAALLPHKEEEPRSASAEPQTSREERRDASPRRPFFYRVLRAAFPLHLLFLLLLVLACLVPLSEDDYSCTLSNNFARSFYPMLRYTNGPPPT